MWLRKAECHKAQDETNLLTTNDRMNWSTDTINNNFKTFDKLYKLCTLYQLYNMQLYKLYSIYDNSD